MTNQRMDIDTLVEDIIAYALPGIARGKNLHPSTEALQRLTKIIADALGEPMRRRLVREDKRAIAVVGSTISAILDRVAAMYAIEQLWEAVGLPALPEDELKRRADRWMKNHAANGEAIKSLWWPDPAVMVGAYLRAPIAARRSVASAKAWCVLDARPGDSLSPAADSGRLLPSWALCPDLPAIGRQSQKGQSDCLGAPTT